MVDEALSILCGNAPLTDFGVLLHEAWQAKRAVSERISCAEIDETYEAARAEGAIGGKITGAGGGGFLLLFVPPSCQPAVRERLHHLLHVPFRFEQAGSQVIFFDRDEDYSALEADRKVRNLAAFREMEGEALSLQVQTS
jgi:D-glycero-alpha-D-manno-heptose-7-phosphate kinase